MAVKIDKTKVMVFNAMEAWVTILEPKFFLGEEKVAYARSYMYLEVTFQGLRFSLWKIA